MAPADFVPPIDSTRQLAPGLLDDSVLGIAQQQIASPVAVVVSRTQGKRSRVVVDLGAKEAAYAAQPVCRDYFGSISRRNL